MMMKCLVCFQLITINNFQDILTMEAPCVCHKCKQYLIGGKQNHLFKQNEWLMSVIERLEKGDFVLLQLFIPRYVKEIKRQLRCNQTITILNMTGKGPYPWGEVLIEQLEKIFSKKDMNRVKLVLPHEVEENTIRIY